MSLTITQKLLGAAAATIAVGGFLAVPAAQAETTCTVPGHYLSLHQANGYDLVISANGTSLMNVLLRRTSARATSGR